MTITDIIRHPVQHAKDLNRIRNIKKGYPVQRSPHIPKLLTKTIDWKTIDYAHGQPFVGFSLASPEDVTADPESLDMIRQFLMEKFENVLEANAFKSDLPRNIVAVSFIAPGFRLGTAGRFHHEFNFDFQVSPSFQGFFTYQRVSPNFQLCYYNEDGNRFNAGFIYYPEIGKQRHVKSDFALIQLAWNSQLSYARCDRILNDEENSSILYGRHCGKAGKHVLVTVKDDEVKHRGYNHSKGSWFTEPCEECLVDYWTYEEGRKDKDNEALVGFVKTGKKRDTTPFFTKISNVISKIPFHTPKQLLAIRKINRGYPITSTPFVPKIMHKLNSWNTNPTIKIAQAPVGPVLVDVESLKMINKFLDDHYESFVTFDEEKRRNIIAISFAEPGFECGNDCNEFILSPGLGSDLTEASDSFSYQKLSENVQVTYYTENGVRYLAGTCYYPVQIGTTKLLETDKALIISAKLLSEQYPMGKEEAGKVEKKIYSRYCEKSGIRVMVGETEDKKLIRHIKWNPWWKKWDNSEYCEECIKDWFENNWVRPVRNEEAQKLPLRSCIRTPKEVPVIEKHVSFDGENPEVLTYPCIDLTCSSMDSQRSSGSEDSETKVGPIFESPFTEDSEAFSSTSQDSSESEEDSSHSELKNNTLEETKIPLSLQQILTISTPKFRSTFGFVLRQMLLNGGANPPDLQTFLAPDTPFGNLTESPEPSYLDQFSLEQVASLTREETQELCNGTLKRWDSQKLNVEEDEGWMEEVSKCLGTFDPPSLKLEFDEAAESNEAISDEEDVADENTSLLASSMVKEDSKAVTSSDSEDFEKEDKAFQNSDDEYEIINSTDSS